MNRQDAELRAALRELAAPAPSPDLLPRILRSRAMGVRIKTPTRRLDVPWRWVAAVAVITLLISGSWMLSVSIVKIRESRVGARDPFGELLSGRWWKPEEGVGEVRPERLEPKYPLILSGSLELPRLSEGQWTYQSTMTADRLFAQPSFVGGTRVRVTRGSHGGQAAWVVTTASRQPAQAWSAGTDTTYLDAVTLRPQYAVAYWNSNRTRMVESYSGERGFQSITNTRRKAWSRNGTLELAFPSNALFTNDWLFAHEFRVLVPALPLARGWRGSLYQTGLFVRSGQDSTKPRALPVDLRVTGTDRVFVPAGRFDCWRVEVESYLTGIERWTMWVSRDNGWLVKAEWAGSDYVRDEVLESYEPGR